MAYQFYNCKSLASGFVKLDEFLITLLYIMMRSATSEMMRRMDIVT